MNGRIYDWKGRNLGLFLGYFKVGCKNFFFFNVYDFGMMGIELSKLRCVCDCGWGD